MAPNATLARVDAAGHFGTQRTRWPATISPTGQVVDAAHGDHARNPTLRFHSWNAFHARKRNIRLQHSLPPPPTSRHIRNTHPPNQFTR